MPSVSTTPLAVTFTEPFGTLMALREIPVPCEPLYLPSIVYLCARLLCEATCFCSL